MLIFVILDTFWLINQGPCLPTLARSANAGPFNTAVGGRQRGPQGGFRAYPFHQLLHQMGAARKCREGSRVEDGPLTWPKHAILVVFADTWFSQSWKSWPVYHFHSSKEFPFAFLLKKRGNLQGLCKLQWICWQTSGLLFFDLFLSFQRGIFLQFWPGLFHQAMMLGMFLRRSHQKLVLHYDKEQLQ